MKRDTKEVLESAMYFLKAYSIRLELHPELLPCVHTKANLDKLIEEIYELIKAKESD